jgi:hypothetical protein
MKKCFWLMWLMHCWCLCANTQPAENSRWQGGLELDVLPYLTGGYFAAAWAGKGHVRLRGLTAGVNRPDLVTTEGFTNHHIEAWVLVGDYFLKSGWKGWWFGGGPVYWKSKIQTDQEQQTAHFSNWLINGSLGYHFLLGKRFYLSPWCGMSVRVGGDIDVPVDDKAYTLPLLNPEASLKAGVIF